MNRLARMRLARPATYRIVGPAWVEAQASGRTQIDLDDLLVATYCVGGRATELLAAHGVTLGSLRQAIHDRDDADLAAIGVDPLRLPRLTAVGLDEVVRITRRVHATPQAERVLARLPMDDLALLAALVGVPGGGPAEALVRCSVDTEALLPACRRATPSPDRVTPPRPVPGLLDGIAQTTIASTHFVPIPMDDVVTMAHDPALVAQWLLSGLDASVDDERTVRVGDIVHRRIGDDPTPTGRAITWQEFRPSEVPGSYLHLDLSPAPGGTRLRLTRGFRGYGRHERLVRTVSARVARMSSGGLVQRLALLASQDAGVQAQDSDHA